MNVRDALFVVSEKLRNHAFSSKCTKHDDGNATASDIIESTASMPVNISSTDNYSTDNFPRTDHEPSVIQMESLENSFSAFHLGSPGSLELEVTCYKKIMPICLSGHELSVVPYSEFSLCVSWRQYMIFLYFLEEFNNGMTSSVLHYLMALNARNKFSEIMYFE